MQQRTLFFNGISAISGKYGLEPMDAGEFAKRVADAALPLAKRFSAAEGEQLRQRSYQQRTQSYSISVSLDPSDLADAGWGAIFPESAPPWAMDALQPLLRLREGQAGDRFRIFAGEEGHRPGLTSTDFLLKQAVSPGWMDPKRVPYYLLLVGSPAEIPFDFQRQLDVQYAVGRICFETPEQYANYAANVLAAEKGERRPAQRAVFFGVANPDDPPSRQAVDLLIRPLHEQISVGIKIRRSEWRVTAIPRDATRARLARLLGGGDAPSLLVAAGHGLEFPPGDPRQRARQGGLLCADWPGPQAWSGRSIPEDFCFSADDLSADADLTGLVAFFFGSYSGGTPAQDELARDAGIGAAPLADAPFVAQLPTRLLGLRKGALAVVGQAGRAWSYSAGWQGAGATTAVVMSALERLLYGSPLGMAMEYFDERYAETATQLDEELFKLQYGKGPDPNTLAMLWIAAREFSNTIILGDPAVRLGGSRFP